jgi:hypothetical protein
MYTMIFIFCNDIIKNCFENGAHALLEVNQLKFWMRWSSAKKVSRMSIWRMATSQMYLKQTSHSVFSALTGRKVSHQWLMRLTPGPTGRGYNNWWGYLSHKKLTLKRLHLFFNSVPLHKHQSLKVLCIHTQTKTSQRLVCWTSKSHLCSTTKYDQKHKPGSCKFGHTWTEGWS